MTIWGKRCAKKRTSRKKLHANSYIALDQTDQTRPTDAGQIAEILINSGQNMNIKLSYGHQEIWIECLEGPKIKIAHLLQRLRNSHPDIYRHWCDQDGNIRPSIQVFVNGEHIRYLNGLETEIGGGDQIYAIPIITGG